MNEPPIADTVITWWGHATTTVTERGTRVLFDPLLTDRLAHLSRRRGPAPRRQVIAADVVAISHLHADHLHVPSLRRLAPGTRTLVPTGAAPLLRDLALDVVEVTPGDTVVVTRDVTIEAVPADHDDRRYPGSRLAARPLGFVVAGLRRTYFPGDTSLRRADVLQAGNIDVLLAPVGGWGPTLGAGHMGPREAATMAKWLAPEVAIPVHWGTFWPTGLRRFRDPLFTEPGRLFADAVADTAGSDVQVHVLAPGETTTVSRDGRPDDGR